MADTNVRPAWRSPAASARETRRFGLARLLLKQLGRLLRKLDLTFLVLLAVAPTPACIIPVGPEWQDPLGNPNAPPQILDPRPYWGAELSTTPMEPQDFTIVITDVNVTDHLFAIWIVDDRFAISPDFETLPRGDGTPIRKTVTKFVGCPDISSSQPRHVVMAAVADRRFTLTDQDNLLALQDPAGLVAIATWTLNLTCQQ